MLRRYLVALVGALAGGGAAAAAVYSFGLDTMPDWRVVAAVGPPVAGFLMARGEGRGLVPAAENLDYPASLFTDEKGQRR